MTNLFSQEPWARRGESDGRVRALETGLALVQTGGWTAYVPVLTQSTAVTLSGGYARYTQVGKTIVVGLALNVSGTGVAANPITVTLPVTAATAGTIAVGSGNIFDTSVGSNYGFIAILSSTGAFAGIPSAFTGGGFIGALGFSAALAAGDLVTATLTYEAA